MTRKALLFILIPMLFLAACSRAAAPAMEAPASMSTMSADFVMGGAPMQESYLAPAAPEAMARDVGNVPQSAERLVVRNADLAIVVADVPARVTAIQKMAEAMGGFVVSSSIYDSYTSSGETVPQAQISIRVPEPRLNDALDQIKAGVVEVQNENQTGTDVTDQYVDLQSRLKAKLAAEEQLTEIMQEAKRTEDVLAVYSQLQQIQSEIEVLRGQIKYTEQSAALSLISATIIAEETIQPLEVGPWKPQGVARDAIQDLIDYLKGFVEVVIRFFLLTLPVLITIAIPFVLLFMLIRWIVRKLRKPKASTSAPPAEAKKK